MTTTAPLRPPGSRPLTSHNRVGAADRAFRTLTLGCGLMVLVILGFIAVSMSQKAWPAISHDGVRFFTTTRWAPNAEVFGSLPFVYGTIVTAVVAIVLSVPISIGLALFLSDVAPAASAVP